MAFEVEVLPGFVESACLKKASAVDSGTCCWTVASSQLGKGAEVSICAGENACHLP